ncbi:hypothetical protein [Nocardiopsis coralliicola]
MTDVHHETRSKFARAHEAIGEARGEARGEAKALLLMLKARGITIDPDTRDRIAHCTDIEQLDRGIIRAATVQHAREIFG